MKVIILAGGFGTRISEETNLRPKPMIEIGGKPLLWHIMKHYSAHGINEFVVCLGYKGEYIKKFFLDYAQILSDFTVDLGNNQLTNHRMHSEDWKVTLLDTGPNTMTGGRIKQALHFINTDSDCCLTYGDGLSDVDVSKKIAFHKSHNKLCTVTAVTPPGRFGVLDVDGAQVHGFREKIASDQYRINGGFFVINPRVAELIRGNDVSWEDEPMHKLADMGEMMAWEHNGFWQPMDTLRDKVVLENLWANGNAPWKVSND